MRLRSQVIGALNLFHTDPHALAPEVTRIGHALADVATIGLIQERALRQHDILIDQLQTALDSRVLIEQAKGVLAERHHIDPGHAFTLLRDHARNHGQRLTELATAVIDGSTHRRRTPPRRTACHPKSEKNWVRRGPRATPMTTVRAAGGPLGRSGRHGGRLLRTGTGVALE
ncbi:MAG: ANTAR domain-containing response regulator [Pseudonocardiaceae bacterium]